MLLLAWLSFFMKHYIDYFTTSILCINKYKFLILLFPLQGSPIFLKHSVARKDAINELSMPAAAEFDALSWQRD